MSAIRTVKYNDIDVSTYEAVVINDRDSGEEHIFNTGNFVKDWFDALKFVLTGGLGEYPILSNSSSVDHFIMDGGGDLYDSAYLEITESSAELKYEYDEDCFEVFVQTGTKPTWKELKEICK